jgi:hypothetical protein
MQIRDFFNARYKKNVPIALFGPNLYINYSLENGKNQFYEKAIRSHQK